MSRRSRRTVPSVAAGVLLVAVVLVAPAALSTPPAPPPGPCTAAPPAAGVVVPCTETTADAVAVVDGRAVRPEDLDAKGATGSGGPP